MDKHCYPSVLVFDRGVWEVTKFRCNHENGACLMSSMRRDSLSVWSLSTMEGHVRRLKSTTQGIPSSQELTIWAPAFWAFSFSNCETMDTSLSCFVFWATKYAFLDFLLEVTFAHLEFSLHLSTSDSIGFWKVWLGYGTIELLNVCFQSSLYVKSLPEILHMSDARFLLRSRALGLFTHSLSES